VDIIDAISATSNWVEPSGEQLGFLTGSSPSSIIRTSGVSLGDTLEDEEDDNDEEELVTCSRARAHICL